MSTQKEPDPILKVCRPNLFQVNTNDTEELARIWNGM